MSFHRKDPGGPQGPILIAVGAAALLTAMMIAKEAEGATVEPGFIESDWMGERCVPESDLDRMFAEMPKGGDYPRTCFAWTDTPSPDILELKLGRPPTEDEEMTMSYRWLVTHHPERKRFGVENPTAPVPVPPTGLLLGSVLVSVFGVWRLT